MQQSNSDESQISNQLENIELEDRNNKFEKQMTSSKILTQVNSAELESRSSSTLLPGLKPDSYTVNCTIRRQSLKRVPKDRSSSI